MLPVSYQRWLDNLATGNPTEAGAPPSMQELLQQLSEGNPRLQAVTRYLALRQQAAAEAEAAAQVEEPDEPAEESPANGLLQRPETRRVIHNLLVELEELRQRNDTLSLALGACYLCWGEDLTCPECQGRGRPGSALPDPVLFAGWVSPAARRLHSGRPARSASGLPPQPTADLPGPGAPNASAIH